MEKLLENPSPSTNWQLELEYFHSKFLHFQLERIIHLAVSLTVGLAGLISCLASAYFRSPYFFILDIILMILFLAYLVYYRKLENTAQAWYLLQDKLKKQIS
jgi:hypothetical protein